MFTSLVARHLSLCSLLLACGAPAFAADIVVRGGWVFETTAEQFVKNQGIVVERGRFARVVTGDDTLGETSGDVIQLTDDDYILPGLVDLHAHYNVRLFRRRREEFDVQPVVYLANGVTTTFPAGEFDPEAMLALRKRIDSGEQLGPRLINSGPYFGSARPGWNRETTRDEIIQQVDHWARQGAGGFKAKGIRAEHLEPLIQQAHSHGLTVTAHLDSGFRNSVNPKDAVLMGIDRVEHFLGGDALGPEQSAYASLPSVTVDMPEFKEIVELFIKRGTYFDATLTAYGYFSGPKEGYDYWFDERQLFTPYVQARVAEKTMPTRSRYDGIFWVKRKTIRAFYEAGGKITMGTDHVSDGKYLPGFSSHRELDAMVLSGIPPAKAIKIGTINGATAIGRQREIGSIEPGKFADLFVVKHNPLESIRHTRSVHTVMKSGTVYRTADLLNSVKGKLGPTSEDESADW